ncbi:uncharacterized protein [Primulina huaijiensis]|uniref:uncharacterized protein n=1 Tax=Primulina huaijiensis TaxID=1492673 RepID=UPI003CC79345
MVEFKTGNPVDVLHDYVNIDFSLVDCKADNYGRLLEKLDVNRKRSVVVANNLLGGGKGLGGQLRGVENKTEVRSMKHPIGRGMEITMIGKSNDFGNKERVTDRKRRIMKRGDKSKWVFEVDEKSGEEHIFRMPRPQ